MVKTIRADSGEQESGAQHKCPTFAKEFFTRNFHQRLVSPIDFAGEPARSAQPAPVDTSSPSHELPNTASMNRALIRKFVGEAKLLAVSTALIMFAFCWLRVWLTSLLPMERFRTILEQFREFERFVPVSFEQLFTYPGRIAMTYDEFIVVASVALWSIARGSDCVAGELGRGTMEMMLAQPVGRRKILLTQATITTLGTACIALASWLGIFAGIQTTQIKQPVAPPVWPTPMIGAGIASQFLEGQTVLVPMRDKVDPTDFLPAALNLFSLGFFLAGLSSFFSSFDRYRWRTIGLVSGIYVLQLIARIVGLASDRFSWLLNFTFFTAYQPEQFVSVAVHTPHETWHLIQLGEQGQWIGLGPLGLNVVLIVFGLVAYAGAVAVFCRRDLPAPV